MLLQTDSVLDYIKLWWGTFSMEYIFPMSIFASSFYACLSFNFEAVLFSPDLFTLPGLLDPHLILLFMSSVLHFMET